MLPSYNPEDYMISLEAIKQGDRLAISRFLSAVENDSQEGRDLMNALFALTGQAYIVGVTGAPGTGKSSLVNELVWHIRKTMNLRIAVIAVDPSSPFSGGALLGDRIRMRDLYGDSDVFIRSVASRGSLGGLAARTSAMVSAFDAAGFELIMIETVGAGQSEVDIAKLAHTVLVVEAPGLGDDIQAIKAGILEIADILVVNKADQPGVENSVRALEAMLSLRKKQQFSITDLHHSWQNIAVPIEEDLSNQETEENYWQPPILKTIALQRNGIADLCDAVFRHKAFLLKSGVYRIKDGIRLQVEFQNALMQVLLDQWQDAADKQMLQQGLKDLLTREISPQALAVKLTEFRPKDSEK
jgi:LAO/AO transport system kinase